LPAGLVPAYAYAMRIIVVAVVLGLALSADARPTKLRKPSARKGFQVKVGAYDIIPGEDLEVCEYRRLPNTKAIDVQKFKLRMPEGAHHFAVWRYGGALTDDAEFSAGPTPSIGCTGFSPDEFFPQLLIPTQSPNTTLSFPEGVALRIEPGEQVFLNPHMKNFDLETTTPDIRFNMYRAKKGTVKHHAEGFTFGNSSAIDIPAGGDQTTVVEWSLPVGMTIVYLSTHQHALGTYARVDLVGENGAADEKIVESFDWEHPDVEWPKGGLRLEQGRTLRLTCEWHNPRDHAVRFGPETTDEMCYGIGFVWREDADKGPVPGCIPTQEGILCPGLGVVE
jgi:hypothetical protein